MANLTELRSLYYDGSTLLMPISKRTNMPLDQLNFFTTHVAAIVFGNIFRIYFSHDHYKPFVRHWIEVILGLSLAYFCYGRNLVDVLIPCLISYALMRWSPWAPSGMAVSVCVFNMLYLSYCHVSRMQLDYGGYTLDVTGPLMIAVQKLTSLAFNLSDGLNSLAESTATSSSEAMQAAVGHPIANNINNKFQRTKNAVFYDYGGGDGAANVNNNILLRNNNNKLLNNKNNNINASNNSDKIEITMSNSNHANNIPKDIFLHTPTPSPISPTNPKHKSQYFIYHPPSLLHLLSYLFSFHSFMCGPFLFFTDHLSFIDGSVFHHAYNINKVPSPLGALKNKTIKAVIFGIITFSILPLLPSSLISGKEFAESSFLWRNVLMVVVGTVCRYKYYFAWTLGEAANVSAGFGFHGYDGEGRPKWDLIDNYDLSQTELGLSMKQFLDNWNRSTNVWLRYLIYDRVRSTMCVFIFSAFWHGFYPGYFIAFLSGGLFLNAARKVRTFMKPQLQKRPHLNSLYNVISFVSTQMILCYIGFPFMLLLLKPTIYVYSNLYFHFHFIGLFILFISHFIPKHKSI